MTMQNVSSFPSASSWKRKLLRENISVWGVFEMKGGVGRRQIPRPAFHLISYFLLNHCQERQLSHLISYSIMAKNGASSYSEKYEEFYTYKSYFHTNQKWQQDNGIFLACCSSLFNPVTGSDFHSFEACKLLIWCIQKANIWSHIIPLKNRDVWDQTFLSESGKPRIRSIELKLALKTQTEPFLQWTKW